MRVCHIRHTLFLSFSVVAYFFLSAMQLPLAVNSMHCKCSLWLLQARMFCVLLPCVFMRNNYSFCLVLEINLRLKEPFLRTNRTPCCKKSILTKVCLDEKRVASECWQNEYLFEEPAICTLFRTIWCKMECVLVLNSVRFGAKWAAFWC